MKLKPLPLLSPLIVATALLAVGCGSSGGGGASGGGGGLSAAAKAAAGPTSGSTVANSDGTPTKGGILRLATVNDLEPATFFSVNNSAGIIVDDVYDTLITYTPKGLEPKPKLATSWKLAPDGKSITLKLREGVKFTNGVEFTSKDVQFSIEQIADPANVSQFQRLAAAVTGFDTSKPHEITLKFAHPLGNIFDLLSITPMMEPNNLKEFKEGKNYIGTGPFEFVSWTPGSKLVFKANPNYWGGAPYLEGIEVDIVTDSSTQVSQLRAGQIDGAFNAGFRDIEALSESGEYSLVNELGADTQIYVGVNVSNSALKNVKLRQAIAYAVDRERILKDVFRGYGYTINLPWPKTSPAFSEKLNHTYDRNLSKAKALIAEVESEDGKIPTLPIGEEAGVANFEATAQIVQSNLEEVGLKVKLEPVQPNQAVKNIIEGGWPGLWVVEHGFAQYTPSTLTISAYPFNAADNTSHFISKEYQDATNAAWEVTDGSSPEALQDYTKLSEVLLKSQFLIELVDNNPIVVVNSDVHGITWSRRGELDLAKAYISK